MPKEEWGVKRVCPHCSTRFYDLQRDPMTCPSCGHSFSLDSLTQGKHRPLIAEKTAPAKARNDEDLDNDDAIIDDDDDGNDVDLGDDVLEDDDDDNVSLDDIADMSSEDDDET
ncbi:TIGR02300 family protein [Rhodovulum sp. MB263]|uniref:TIGR02300 family protein n=1 Tax=unclassified Rhodovulum TaxID=2631432 RepID=UPI0009B743FB|nr:TIGR02300 family protein [Rhodovulum sp. MB263]ARC89749.1 TIGR02300 family protein [Rhodovulum sp. MB263]